jgi:SAM-dependent methyltransferase
MKRRTCQGLITVLRFNWHFYLIAIAGILTILAAAWLLVPASLPLAAFIAFAGMVAIDLSLAATLYAYDLTGLYTLGWLEPWVAASKRAANIHAGFDETTELLRELHPDIEWTVMDFYDPQKHTEVSIKRARAAHPPQHGTQTITTSHVPLDDSSLDCVLLMLSAHEIRDRDERIGFFRELHRVIAENGTLIVTEHLRDLPNIIAYNIGAWHFHPRSEWLATFEGAGLRIATELKNNALITTFILKKRATPS